jgi:phosphoribosylformylglycinamidine (FGAM) synthase-like enzyme
VGLLEDADRVLRRPFPDAGLDVVLLGEGFGELGGSEFLKTIHGLVRGLPPRLDLVREKALQHLMVELASEGLVRSAHDCAEGGIAVTIAECCFETAGVGVSIDVPSVEATGGFDSLTAALFGESASRVIVSTDPAQAGSVLARAQAAGVPAARIGRTGGARIVMTVGGEAAIDVSLASAEERWTTSLAAWVAGRAA